MLEEMVEIDTGFTDVSFVIDAGVGQEHFGIHSTVVMKLTTASFATMSMNNILISDQA